MDFPQTLATALARCGRSLSQVSLELRDRGAPVSASTLSAWQTGLSRPERASSLAAVTALEEILGLAPQRLVSTLPARRPRGRRREAAQDHLQAMWRSSDATHRVLAKLDADWRDVTSPALVSSRLQVRLGPDGQELVMRVARVVKAGPLGAERMISIFRYGCLRQVPLLSEAHGCRLNRFRGDAESGVAAFEFLLDPPLTAGEMTLAQFELRYPPGQNEKHISLRAMEGMREITLSVLFDPAYTPPRCQVYHQREAGAPSRTVREARGTEMRETFQYIGYEPTPGVYGIRWD